MPATRNFRQKWGQKRSRVLLLPLAAASHGKDLGDPDEDVDGIGVDPDRAVDGVELSGAVERVSLGPVDDLLGVVEQEAAKEDQTSVQGQRVDTGAKSSSLKEWKSSKEKHKTEVCQHALRLSC